MTPVFWAWRLNPMACLVEGIVILMALLQSQLLDAPRLQTTWKTRLHSAAASLLLLRAEKMSGDGEIIIEGLLNEHLSASVQIQRTTGDGGEWRLEMWREGSAHPHGNEHCPSSLRQFTTSHRSQTELNPRFLRLKEAVGSNALSRADFWVDLVTLFSAILVIVKVSAMTIAWDIRVACYFIFFGWAMVQVLVMLLHSKEVEEIEWPEVMDFLSEYQRRIRGNWALPLPYCFAYTTAFPGFVYFRILSGTLANDFTLNLFWFNVLFVLALSGAFIAAVLVGSALFYIVGKALGYFIGEELGFSIGEAIMTLFFYLLPIALPFCIWYFPGVSYNGFFYVGPATSTTLIFLTPAINFNFSGALINFNDSDSEIFAERIWFILFAITNFLISIGFMALIILCYDSSGTNKPLWLEYFG